MTHLCKRRGTSVCCYGGMNSSSVGRVHDACHVYDDDVHISIISYIVLVCVCVDKLNEDDGHPLHETCRLEGEGKWGSLFDWTWKTSAGRDWTTVYWWIGYCKCCLPGSSSGEAIGEEASGVGRWVAAAVCAYI